MQGCSRNFLFKVATVGITGIPAGFDVCYMIEMEDIFEKTQLSINLILKRFIEDKMIFAGETPPLN